MNTIPGGHDSKYQVGPTLDTKTYIFCYFYQQHIIYGPIYYGPPYLVILPPSTCPACLPFAVVFVVLLLLVPLSSLVVILFVVIYHRCRFCCCC